MRPRLRRRVIAAAALCGLVGVGTETGWGYRFYRSYDRNSHAPRGDTARGWDPTVWGPGDTLVWHLLDDSLWQPHFSGAGEVLPLVEEVLDTWAAIPSAEVRWRVAGIASGEQSRDGRNTVSPAETEDWPGRARRLSRSRNDGPWETIECDIQLATGYVERLAGSRDNRLNTLLHEFGHCLGLRHAATTPTIRWDSWRWTDSSVWQKDPQMSYGWDIDNALSEDEVIGASLLRPAPGWLRTVGSISGSVTLDGRPARYVSVEVLRNDGGRARPSVQVFTDDEGAFLAEGLAPGEYVLWIHPMFRLGAHSALVSAGAATDPWDLVVARRHRVRAGQETAAGEFAVTRGRDQR